MPDASEESAVNESNVQSNTASESQEPKNVQELTNYIQSMLQQMQDRFQTIILDGRHFSRTTWVHLIHVQEGKGGVIPPNKYGGNNL